VRRTGGPAAAARPQSARAALSRPAWDTSLAPQSVAGCSCRSDGRILYSMGGPSKERQWGETIRHAEQRARETRFIADVAACDAWNYRMERATVALHSPPRRLVTR
jgi:hypothetical protein